MQGPLQHALLLEPYGDGRKVGPAGHLEEGHTWFRSDAAARRRSVDVHSSCPRWPSGGKCLLGGIKVNKFGWIVRKMLCALKSAGYDKVCIRKPGQWAPKSNAWLGYIQL